MDEMDLGEKVADLRARVANLEKGQERQSNAIFRVDGKVDKLLYIAAGSLATGIVSIVTIIAVR